MTLTVIQNDPGHRWPGGVKELRISCDRMTCDIVKNDQEIKEAGGLKAMGWTTEVIDGQQRHYCPEHSTKE